MTDQMNVNPDPLADLALRTRRIVGSNNRAAIDEHLSDLEELARAAIAEHRVVLDRAWAGAVAALPEGQDERALSVWWDNRKPSGWWAAAVDKFSPIRPIPLIVKGYKTPEAALDALRDALRSQP